MRKVIVYAYVKKEGNTHFDKVEDGKGFAMFHEWGCNYEEFDSGAGNFSTAIIERADGTVENVSVEMIKFVESNPQ